MVSLKFLVQQGILLKNTKHNIHILDRNHTVYKTWRKNCWEDSSHKGNLKLCESVYSM